MRRMAIILALTPSDEALEALRDVSTVEKTDAFLRQLIADDLLDPRRLVAVIDGGVGEYDDERLRQMAAQAGAGVMDVIQAVDAQVSRDMMIGALARMQAREIKEKIGELH